VRPSNTHPVRWRLERRGTAWRDGHPSAGGTRLSQAAGTGTRTWAARSKLTACPAPLRRGGGGLGRTGPSQRSEALAHSHPDAGLEPPEVVTRWPSSTASSPQPDCRQTTGRPLTAVHSSANKSAFTRLRLERQSGRPKCCAQSTRSRARGRSSGDRSATRAPVRRRPDPEMGNDYLGNNLSGGTSVFASPACATECRHFRTPAPGPFGKYRHLMAMRAVGPEGTSFYVV
jgi:hypothetical protein